VHPRMPVMLLGEETHLWLESGNQTELISLLKPADPSLLQAWPVSREVNTPAQDGPELIQKI
jgi:putative SOS response-associated peptidase YedK